MDWPRTFRQVVLFLSLFAFLGGLAACGGGGAGGAAAPTRVSVFLTDGPTDDFSHVYVTVTSVALLGDSGEVVLLSGEKRFDLLALTSEAALLTNVEGLPEGSYNKMRLEVSKVEIVRQDGTAVGDVKVPSGKIDLNPQGPFVVAAGQPLIIVLDFDAEKSIHVVDAGKNGKVIFRPVVFVKVADAVSFDRLVKASGIASQVGTTSGNFFLGEGDDGEGDDAEGDDSEGDDGENDRDGLRILTGERTSFFGPDGLPSSFSALVNGEFVTVAGFPVMGRGDDEDDDPLGIDAVVAEMGTAWRSIAGTVISPPAPDGVFPFLPNDEAWGASAQVVLQTGTRVYGPFGQELSFSDLLPGSRVRVDAVPSGDLAAGFTLRAALVVLRTPVAGAVGTITAVDGSALAFSLKPAGGGTVAVQATPGTLILLVGITPDGVALTEAAFSDLAPGQMAAVSGYQSASGTLQAACVAAWWPSEFPAP